MKYKIDLHLHTPASRQNGDVIKWDSLFETIRILKNENIKIASFSDHNVLDVDQYCQAKELGKKVDILFLPAIEVNVVRLDGKIANIIFVFDSDLSIKELNKISSIAKKNIPKRGISLQRCNSIFSEFQTIKIPHVGKSDHFKYEDLMEISFDAMEISNEKHKNYLNVLNKGIISSIVAFSDTHKWNMYPEQGKLITKIKLENLTFKNLKEALMKNKNYFERR